ncbi:unnamed protein product [Adineta ricciae]|uniref:Uncharacterized protein n=1 Tax=Adineta ricciae TaxID=249248 RepID=A0A813RS74_ADIRI|nr:unnamed protein product [Adineta ricciae]CAF0797284.1 unnamed protein product [Adineta ricciae]
MGECQGENILLSNADKTYCPFIETLSFGSDIDIQCNSTFLVFNEINNDVLKWKFANQTAICNQSGTQQAQVNQCGVERFEQHYLRVPLISSDHRETSCIYCRINYKPIAPSILVTQTNHLETVLYTINITSTRLNPDESFEILWARRLHEEIHYSINYWFLPKCIHPSVKILENNTHTIVFFVDDSVLSRVEFIIRRCHGTCRTYDTCDENEFYKQSDSNDLTIPDSIEKLSCDADCLAGLISVSSSTETSSSSKLSFIIPSTNSTPSNDESKIIVIIIFSLSGLLLIIPLVIFIIYMLCRKKERHVYAKTSNVDPDGQK